MCFRLARLTTQPYGHVRASSRSPGGGCIGARGVFSWDLSDAPRTLSALALVCTLKPSPAESSSQLFAKQLLDALSDHGVTGTAVWMVDYDIRPGAELDQGGGERPHRREQIIASDIVVLVSPTWMGRLTSVAQRVLERLDAERSQTGGDGRCRRRGPHRSGHSRRTCRVRLKRAQPGHGREPERRPCVSRRRAKRRSGTRGSRLRER